MPVLPTSQFMAFRQRSREIADRELAREYISRHPVQTEGRDEDAVTQDVREARLAANRYGVTDSRLRSRFILLSVLRAPRFWEDDVAHHLLSAPSGTGDIRFGDLCRLFKLAAERAGTEQEVWWS